MKQVESHFTSLAPLPGYWVLGMVFAAHRNAVALVVSLSQGRRIYRHPLPFPGYYRFSNKLTNSTPDC
jgi:hypothetical protein